MSDNDAIWRDGFEDGFTEGQKAKEGEFYKWEKEFERKILAQADSEGYLHKSEVLKILKGEVVDC